VGSNIAQEMRVGWLVGWLVGWSADWLVGMAWCDVEEVVPDNDFGQEGDVGRKGV